MNPGTIVLLFSKPASSRLSGLLLELEGAKLMSIDINDLHALPDVEKLRIVELLWDDLGESPGSIPLPDWAIREAGRRREEMSNPQVGVSHDEVWRRIANRNG
jgi:putative addiction module component (TIGR02574 family)